MTVSTRPSDERVRFAPGPVDSMVPAVYQELRTIAHRHLTAVAPSATFATCELVHEAYLKLADQSDPAWESRAHFLAQASVVMRHVLVDRARERASLKRGGGRRNITFEEEIHALDGQSELLLELNEALDDLAQLQPRLARVVECRFFGGLSESEIAEALQVTVRTVERDWAKARMLLRRALAS